MDEFLNSLKIAPDAGARLQGKLFNTAVRGARKGKYYLRSASSGTGKTRQAVGDACYLSYPIRYSQEQQKWEYAGGCEKSLVVVTEQEDAEVKSLILAYLTGINEEVLLYGTYTQEQEKIIRQAILVMDKYPNVYITRMSNPSIAQLQVVVREQVILHGIENLFYDYIFSNPALLNEFRDLKIREDVALGMFSSALKDLAVEENIFVFSSTQTNANVDNNGVPIKNESMIRGARSIADKSDVACFISRPTQEEINKLGDMDGTGIIPNQVTDIYKMRRGKYTNIRIWSSVDLGTCRKSDLFVTDGQFNIVQMDNLKQQYMEDEDIVWNINTEIELLNAGVEGTVDMETGELVDSGYTEAIQEIKKQAENQPFKGLLI